MAAAVSELLQKRVSRIILTRPAVEAGEKLGFLPGDLEEKINPYLRPLHDALFDMLDAEKVKMMIEQAGMRWHVVESLPVTDAIKTAGSSRDSHINSYKQSMINLAESGIGQKTC